MAKLEVVGDRAQLALSDFQIAYVAAECHKQRVLLTDGWALRLEDLPAGARFCLVQGATLYAT
jgi:hypothetical protein